MMERAAMSRILCFLGVLIVTGFLLACGAKKVHYLSEQRFSPTPESEEIKLFVNDVQRPHVALAVVESFSRRETDTETKRQQLLDLRQRARDLGADAIVNVRFLNNEIRGFVVDEAVPFRSYRQGRYEMYFLRGTAIKYLEVDAAEGETSMDSVTATPMPEGPTDELGIPTITTVDPQTDDPVETVPAGLGPSVP